jgi:predicted ester cyclase
VLINHQVSDEKRKKEKPVNKLFVAVLVLLTAIGIVMVKNNDGAAATSTQVIKSDSTVVSDQIETNKLLAHRFFEEIVGGGRLALIDEIITSDAIDRTQKTPGRDGFRQHVIWFRTAFPDMKITITDLISEGGRVVVYWTIEGTHKGEFWGVQPTGRKINARAISIIKVKKDQIVEYDVRPDSLGILMQLGSLGQYAGRFAKESK